MKWVPVSSVWFSWCHYQIQRGIDGKGMGARELKKKMSDESSFPCQSCLTAGSLDQFCTKLGGDVKCVPEGYCLRR
jgi:hypothetical protein